MIKILFCVSKLSIGGVERRLSQLMIGLSKLRTYSLYCIVNNNERLLEPDIARYVNIIDINSQTQKDIVVEQYKRVICDIKPDIVHCWTISQCEIINALEQHFRNNFIYICGAVNSAYKYPIDSHRYALMEDCIKKADIILSNSDAGLKAKRISLEKSLVIKNGYNFERLAHIDNSYIDENIKTHILNYDKMVLMGCRICMEKDIRMFINLAKYLNQGNRYLFVLVGDGNLCNEDFFNSINETSNILYLGFRRDIDALIQMSTTCVLFSNPPHEEGISNFIIEAMAQGKPVIATTGGGTNEIIVSGHNGFLVDTFDYISAATIIEELLNDTTTYNRISRYAFETIHNKFNFKSMLKQYHDLYTSIIHKKHS